MDGYYMVTAVITIRLYVPWAHSLKDKRSEVKSLVTRLRQKFNISVIESGDQDVHQMIVLTVAALAFDNGQADSIKDSILKFIEQNSEAEVVTLLVDKK
jgi:uncharacterized protein YlxP (DUF503 family)